MSIKPEQNLLSHSPQTSTSRNFGQGNQMSSSFTQKQPQVSLGSTLIKVAKNMTISNPHLLPSSSSLHPQSSHLVGHGGASTQSNLFGQKNSSIKNTSKAQRLQPMVQQRSQTQILIHDELRAVPSPKLSSNLALVGNQRLKREHEQLVAELSRLSPLKMAVQSQRRQGAITSMSVSSQNNINIQQNQTLLNSKNSKVSAKIKAAGQKLGGLANKSSKTDKGESEKRSKQTSSQSYATHMQPKKSSSRQLTKLDLESDGPKETRQSNSHIQSTKYASTTTNASLKLHQNPRTNFGSYISSHPQMSSQTQTALGQMQKGIAQSSFLHYSAKNNNKSAKVSVPNSSNHQSMSINHQISQINATNSNQSSFLRHSRNNSQSTNQVKVQNDPVQVQNTANQALNDEQKKDVLYLKQSQTQAQLATQMSLGSFPPASVLLPSNLITASSKRPHHRHTGSALLVMPPNQKVFLGDTAQITCDKNGGSKTQSGNHGSKKSTSALGSYSKMSNQPALGTSNTQLISMQKLGGDHSQKLLKTQLQLDGPKTALKNSSSTYKTKQMSSQIKSQIKSSRKTNAASTIVAENSVKIGVKSYQTCKNTQKVPISQIQTNLKVRSGSRKRVEKNQGQISAKSRQQSIPESNQVKEIGQKMLLQPKQILNYNSSKQVPQSTKNATSKQKIQKDLLASFYNPKKGQNYKKVTSIAAIQSLKQILSPKTSTQNQASMLKQPINVDGLTPKQSQKTLQTISAVPRKTKQKQIVSSLRQSQAPQQQLQVIPQGFQPKQDPHTAMASNRSSLQSSFIKVGFNGQMLDNSNLSINEQYGLHPEQQCQSQIALTSASQIHTKLALNSAKYNSRPSSVKKRQIQQLKSHQQSKGSTQKNSPIKVEITSPSQQRQSNMHSANTIKKLIESAKKAVNLDKRDDKDIKIGLSSSKTLAILPQTSSGGGPLTSKHDQQQPPRNLQTALGLSQNFTGQLSSKGQRVLQQIAQLNSIAKKTVTEEKKDSSQKPIELKTTKSNKSIHNQIEVNQNQFGAIIKDQVARKNRVQVKSSLAIPQSQQQIASQNKFLQKKALVNKLNMNPRSQQAFYHQQSQTSQKQLNFDQTLLSSSNNTQMKNYQGAHPMIQDQENHQNLLKQLNPQNEKQIKKAQDKLGGKSLATNLHSQYTSQKGQKKTNSLQSPKQRLIGTQYLAQPNASGAFNSQISTTNTHKKLSKKLVTQKNNNASDFQTPQASDRSEINAAPTSSSQYQQSVGDSLQRQNQKLEILGIYKYARQQVRARGRRGDQAQHPKQLQARPKPLGAVQSQAVLTQVPPTHTSSVHSFQRPISHHSRQKSLQDGTSNSQKQRKKTLVEATSAIERDYKQFIDGEDLVSGSQQQQSYHVSSSQNLKRKLNKNSGLFDSQQIENHHLASTQHQRSIVQSQLSLEGKMETTGLSKHQFDLLREYKQAQDAKAIRNQHSECQVRRDKADVLESNNLRENRIRNYQKNFKEDDQVRICSSQIFDQQNEEVMRNYTVKSSMDIDKSHVDQNTSNEVRGRARLARKDYLENQEITSQHRQDPMTHNSTLDLVSDSYQGDKTKQKGVSLSARKQDQTQQTQAFEALQLYVQSRQNKRREFSEPHRMTSYQTHKMYIEADLLVLEDRSNSRQRSFKIFEDKRVFSQARIKSSGVKEEETDEKHDECDYDTEPEHVYKARDLMLEDLHESIKFFVKEKPADLVYNLHLRSRRR